MDLETDKVKKFILEELIKKSKFGGSHTPFDNIINHLPDEFLYNKKGKKLIENAVKELNNQGWLLILKKRTGKGSDLHISINPRAIKEISAFLGLNK
ncbi:MAG TPA: hypothetical protein VJJ23_02905 [Candidatus Nanoarchaeia archaeon]|nr:hypothetical protein [Candidatus Nanoarchaeia archaeon]